MRMKAFLLQIKLWKVKFDETLTESSELQLESLFVLSNEKRILDR